MIKYLIFDLDWTLIKSDNLILNIILDIIEKYDKNYIEKSKELFPKSRWMPLYDQIKILFEDKNITEEEIKKLWDLIYKKIIDSIDNFIFFNWIPEKIKELSKKYKLFLTTWNSTKFAIEILKKWNIEGCFDLIYWSDKLKKWIEHLNTFKNYSNDEYFFENSLYFWDWDMDKYYASLFNIKFVRIWNKNKYKKEAVIQSIADIWNSKKVHLKWNKEKLKTNKK